MSARNLVRAAAGEPEAAEMMRELLTRALLSERRWSVII
jgi:hypothetical protein